MGSLASVAIPGISKNFGAFNPATQPQLQPQPQAQQPQSIPPQGVPEGMGNLGAIFQSLLPMIMNGGLFGAQQNQGQRALNAVNSGGVFSPGSTAIQPQYNRQISSMQDATARLGNLSRFGQPSNTMPVNQPYPPQSNSPTQNPGQAVNTTPAFSGTKIATEGPGFDPPRIPTTATPQQPAAYSPYQMRTNSGTPTQTVQTSSQPARPVTTATSGTMTPAQQYNRNMNQLTPAQRQMQAQQAAMGQKSQVPTNPWARKSLIR